MAKKIALLISLVMIFSFSCVFASEVANQEESVEPEVIATALESEDPEENLLISPAPSEDIAQATDLEEIEEIPVDVENEPVTTQETTETTPASTTTTGESTTATASSDNGTVVGAIIAVVIVIAVVAIVAVLQKK